MAVAYDAASGQKYAVGATSLTYAHTCTGSNRGLMVSVMLNVSDDRLTGVTYGGVAMTKVDSQVVASTYIHYVYRLANAASGSNNVVVSVSSSCNIFSSCVSYTGVDQTNMVEGTAGKNQGTGTSISASTTTLTDGAWVYGGGALNSDPTKCSAGASTTGRAIGGSFDYAISVDSGGAVSPAGSRTLAISSSASQGLGIIVVAIKPYVEPVASTFVPRIMFF